MKLEAGLLWATDHARRLIAACQKTAHDGTVLFTPDGVGNYDALWIRDFGYMVEYCADLMDPDQIRGCIDYAIGGQREDGWIPDRMEAGGDAVYAAGAKGAPVGKANLDNTPFLVYAVYFYLTRLPREECRQRFLEWSAALDKGLSVIPLSPDGMVWNDKRLPHSPYGFTDTVCKTGRLFMESLLFWRACRQMEAMHEAFGDQDMRKLYRDHTQLIEQAVGMLYDGSSGTYLAAEDDCRQTDVWGMLYALEIGFPLPHRDDVERWLLENRQRYLYKGQVCQLPDGGAWDKLLIHVPAGEYQNGAYWATASGWALRFFRRRDPHFFETMLDALMEDFEKDGICECVNEGYRKLPKFVVSATNVRGGLL